MTQRYFSSPIKLGEFSAIPESEIPQKVQVIRTGTFHHKEYGTFEITKDTLISFVRNFNAKILGIDCAIDYAHESHKQSAAWIQALHLSEDGNELWAEVKWTPVGKETLVKREYRYLSAEFAFDYEDIESLKKYGPTLLGAGLTNRPVIKNMVPAIELSEGYTMTPEEQAKADQMKKDEAAAAAKKAADPVAAAAPPAPAADGKDAEIAALQAKIAELEQALAANNLELAESKEAKALSDKTTQFNKLMSEGKVVEAQREAFITGDAIKLAELSQPVKLNQQGSGKDPVETVTNAEEEIIKLASKLLSEKKAANLGDAISLALKENPQITKQIKV